MSCMAGWYEAPQVMRVGNPVLISTLMSEYVLTGETVLRTSMANPPKFGVPGSHFLGGTMSTLTCRVDSSPRNFSAMTKSDFRAQAGLRVDWPGLIAGICKRGRG